MTSATITSDSKAHVQAAPRASASAAATHPVTAVALPHLPLILLPPRGGPLEGDVHALAAFDKFCRDASLKKLAFILTPCLPAIADRFSPWLIWCFRVDQLIKEMLPKAAGTWCVELICFKVEAELLKNRFCRERYDFSLERICSTQDLNFVRRRTIMEIQSLKDQVLRRHGK